MLAGVIFVEERGQALIEFGHRLVTTDIDVIILHRGLQTLGHDLS